MESHGITIGQLGQILEKMVVTAKEGATAAQYHMFGIMYANALDRKGVTPSAILATTGLSPNYGAEINKGKVLAGHVELHGSEIRRILEIENSIVKMEIENEHHQIHRI